MGQLCSLTLLPRYHSTMAEVTSKPRRKKKNPVNKNQGWEPSIKSTRQMRTQVDTSQRKKTNNLARSSYKSFMTSEKIWESLHVNGIYCKCVAMEKGARGDWQNLHKNFCFSLCIFICSLNTNIKIEQCDKTFICYSTNWKNISFQGLKHKNIKDVLYVTIWKF